MADEIKKYLIKGVPTDAQLESVIDKLIADEKARVAALKEAKKKKG